MYIPPHFEESRPEQLHALIAHHPLGILITRGTGGLNANHLPFELEVRPDASTLLHTHVARANPVWQEFASGDEVLVVFRGPDAYVSPNWYPSTHEQHRQVPTWNYMVAHAHGRVTVHEDEDYIRGVVGRLTKQHEASLPRPWRMSDSSPAFIAERLTAVVGLEIAVARLVGKFKLNQNKEVRDAVGAAQALSAQGHTSMAEAILDRVARRSEPETS